MGKHIGSVCRIYRGALILVDNVKDCLCDLFRQEISTESLITFAEAGEGSVTCKIKLGIDTLPFKIELFEVRVLLLVVAL